jgi:putative NADH-flavin reductase
MTVKIALIGATGFIGSRILEEASSRGHEITALVRRPERVPALPGVKASRVDVHDTDALTGLLAGHDAVISAFSTNKDEPDVYESITSGHRSIIEATKKAGVERLLAVGGAGSLEIAPGCQLIDEPDFPEAWKPGALATREFLYVLRKEPLLDWTFLSPASMIQPGERTGKFRLGGDQLLVDAEGCSLISVEDYAVAMIDELESPGHSRRRFTLAY